MESKPGHMNPETAPEIARHRSEEPPQRQPSERVQRALGRTATAGTSQDPAFAKSERALRELGRTAVEGASPSRTPSRDRG
jgi:hypothetical protein